MESHPPVRVTISGLKNYIFIDIWASYNYTVINKSMAMISCFNKTRMLKKLFFVVNAFLCNQ